MIKTKMILNQARAKTSQLIFDQVIIVIDENGQELTYSAGTPIAIIILHKEGCESKKYNQSRKSIQWDVEIEGGTKNIKKTFYCRKSAHSFIKEQLLNS